MNNPVPRVGSVHSLSDGEFQELCEATDAAILDGGGFGWLQPPQRSRLEAYWRGVLLVPERELFIAWLDNHVCGSAQLVRAPRNNEAQRESAYMQSLFIAPWARRHGLARMLVRAVEKAARAEGFKVLNLDIRDTQQPAIALFEKCEFVRWGTHPHYARAQGRDIPGHFYYKLLVARGRKGKTDDTADE